MSRSRRQARLPARNEGRRRSPFIFADPASISCNVVSFPFICAVSATVSGDVEIIGVRISAFDDRAFKPTSDASHLDEDLNSRAPPSSGSVRASKADVAASGEKAPGRHVQWETSEPDHTATTASRALSKTPSPAADRKGKMSKVKPDLPMKDNKDCECSSSD